MRTNRRISEPQLIVLILGAAAVMVASVIAIIETSDIWLGLLTLVAMALLGAAIVLEMRAVIARGSDAPAPPPASPGRCVVVTTEPMTAPQVLDALGPEAGEMTSLMIVAPEGLGTTGRLVVERDYERAHRAEAATVAALRSAGINAAGQVGDRNPHHAIETALELFPAGRVVVVAHGSEDELYRRAVDLDELARRTGADVRMRQAIKA